MRTQSGWGPARPTTYRGTQMRSRLEASWAAAFDNHDLAWEYEPCAFADQTGQYLPDFYLPSRDLFVEIKPETYADAIYATGPSDEHPLLRCMQIIWSSQPDARLAVFCGQPDLAHGWCHSFCSDTDEHQWWWRNGPDWLWTS